MNKVPTISYDTLPPEVIAFSTTRHGGVSTGSYASLNCTPYTGDSPECVRRNQEILMQSLPQRPRELIIPWQTHGTKSLVIDEEFLATTPSERHTMLQGIDALITRVPGICLCISTADCIPILLYDRSHHVIAAIHAGWRGTVAHIVLHTLKKMYEFYDTKPGDILAAIGPGISVNAFEVGDEVFHAFHEAGYPTISISFFDPGVKKHLINLPVANQLELRAFGVFDSQIETSDICTYTQYHDFFSARRLGTNSGRILSGIMIRTPEQSPE